MGIVIVFTRFTGLPFGRLIGVMWRPLLASATMALTLWGAMASINAQWPMVPLFAKLVMLILLGATAYACAALALWFLVRRPASAERMVLKFLHGRISAFRLNFDHKS
jgi:hypothetical protein